MLYGFLQLNTVDVTQTGRPGAGSEDSTESFIDIVAVHGLNEDRIKAWIDEKTNILWLRDLLPGAISTARILTYGYDASAASFYSAGCADTIQRYAHTLVASLEADRSLEGCDHRPIIFICHGLGGVLVKKALAYSASRTSSQVAHLYSIFVSTFGILFFGTPHNSMDTAKWFELDPLQNWVLEKSLQLGKLARTNSALQKDLQNLETITDQFAPLMKQFHVFFFWEQLKTRFGDHSAFVVEELSAAPIFDNTESCGIHATHSNLAKFSDRNSTGYRTVLATLKRYCQEAPAVISHRWQVALETLSRTRMSEAFQLSGITSYNYDTTSHRRTRENRKFLRCRHYFVPQETAADFIGRESTLRSLETAFFGVQASDNETKRFVLYGMGGSGKTQLSSKWARDNRDRYWAVFTIHAASVETARESFAKIGKISGIGDNEDAGKYWLSQLEEPWLLIIDNAYNPDLDLSSLFPESETGHILITTRNPDFRSYGTAGSAELRGLKQQEALQLLLTRADVPKPWDAKIEATGNNITRTLGYLALALIQAGTAIQRKICDLTDYLNFYDLYRKRRPETEQLLSSPEDLDIVYSSFDFSLTYLRSRDTAVSRDAVELLNIIGFFHFKHIRVDIFTRAVENRRKALPSSVGSPVPSRLLNVISARLQPPVALPDFLRQNMENLHPYRVRRALHELYSLSLIVYDGQDCSFSLHPLIHTWTRDRLDKREKALWAQIALNTLTESILLPPNDTGELYRQYRHDILPHLDACLTACPIQFTLPSGPLGRYQLLYAKFFQQTLMLIIRGQALNAGKCGFVYAERGRFEIASTYQSMVSDILLGTLGEHNEKTTAAMLGLAGTYWELGRLDEAIAIQKRVVKARSEDLGPDSGQTLLAMDQLGRSYWLHGQYIEALQLQQETTDRMTTVLGLENDDTLSALDNLGVTLGSWYRYQESLEIHQQVLEVREKRKGPSDLDTLTTMNNLAMALLNLGCLDESKSIMQKVYEARKAKLGKEHPWTLWALCNLAKVNTELGLLQEAETKLLEGIAAGKRCLSDDHLGVLMGRGVLARVYTRQGRWAEAEALAVETIAKVEKSRGVNHPDSIFAWWRLGGLLELRYKVAEAQRAWEVALERARVRLTEEHPLCGMIEERLAVLAGKVETVS